MSYAVYRVNLPHSPEAVMFVNGFVARDLAGSELDAVKCRVVAYR